jgi:hypothetical protein
MQSWAILGSFNDVMPAAQIAKHHLKWGKDMQDAEEKQLYLGHKVMRWLKNS